MATLVEKDVVPFSRELSVHHAVKREGVGTQEPQLALNAMLADTRSLLRPAQRII